MTPRTPRKQPIRRQLFPPTPMSRKALRRIAPTLLGRAASTAAKRMNPYLAAAATAYEGVQAARSYMKKRKVSYPKKKGMTYNMGRKIGRGTRRTTIMDKCAEQGFVQRRQNGTVKTTLRNVLYVAQSTMPVGTVFETAIKALVKRLLVQANLRVKNENEFVVEDQYYNSEIRLQYKVVDGLQVITQTFVVTAATTTFAQLCQAISNWFWSLAGTTGLPTQFLNLRYYVQYGTLANALGLLAEIDLQGVSFTVHTKSALKLQNRTINSTGNNEADDVDNVPIGGKFFEYRSNGTMYRDYNTPSVTTPSMLTTSAYEGVLPIEGNVGGTSFYSDIPLKTQFIGCRTSGNYNLNPGSIRTSTIGSRETYGFSKFVVTCLNKERDPAGNARFNQFWLGKTRLFAFEKQIMAAVADATSAVTVAYEHELDCGVIVNIKRSLHTAPAIVNSTGIPDN